MFVNILYILLKPKSQRGAAMLHVATPLWGLSMAKLIIKLCAGLGFLSKILENQDIIPSSFWTACLCYYRYNCYKLST